MNTWASFWSLKNALIHATLPYFESFPQFFMSWDRRKKVPRWSASSSAKFEALVLSGLLAVEMTT